MQIVGVPMFADGDAKTFGLLFDGSNAPDSHDESGDQTQAEDKSDTQGNDERDSAGPDLTSRGLTSATTDESPQFGAGVEWDDRSTPGGS